MHSKKFIQADYIWLDGAKPTQFLRSKVRILPRPSEISLKCFDEWGFDGSSTYQATGHDSDLTLKPVSFYPDPIRGEGCYLVLCEVNNPDGTPHKSNSRARLREVLDAGGRDQEPWVGFEQEYTLFHDGRPLGWPTNGYPAPQGPFYCSVGSNVAYGREIVEAHTQACMDAGILIYGTNAEVMPGQWEYQVGYRGSTEENPGALEVSDQAWVARYLLALISEEYDVAVSFDVKPVKGDWNGAGMHTNFSTRDIRDPKIGKQKIEEAVERLKKRHQEHVDTYGHNNHERLTGKHETCSIDEFRAGVADRGAAIRIPRSVDIKGCGYFEDRRPGANANPYDVSFMLVSTVLGIQTN